MEPFVLKQNEYLTIQDWEQRFPNLVVGFSTKNGGVSPEELTSLNLAFHVNDANKNVCTNRDILATKIQFPLHRWVGAEQTHRTHIQNVGVLDIGKGAKDYESALSDTDGLFTKEKGILLTLCYADCVPLYFFHPATATMAIAHAGWKGTVLGIAKEMIHKFKEAQIPPSEVNVAIGPSIGKKQYIVNDVVIDEVKKILPNDNQKVFEIIGDGQYLLDLKELNHLLLCNEGVVPANILISNYCTSTEDSLFFSHRRDAGKTGRMLSFIGWREGV